jgi:gamma-aminobutyric acid type B receptor
VAFSSQGDRIALTQIEQMIDGQYHKLGYYDTQADNLTWFNSEQWVGGKVSQKTFTFTNQINDSCAYVALKTNFL